VHVLRIIRMELIEPVDTQVRKLLDNEGIVDALPCVLECNNVSPKFDDALDMLLLF